MPVRVANRPWTAIAAALLVYVLGGIWLRYNNGVESWMFKIGTAAATIVPLAFVAIYTWLGFHGAAKWWTNTIGTAIVEAALSLIPIVVPLAIAIWFYNGSITPSWLGWCEIAGPVVAALAWLQICVLWLVISRRDQVSK